MVSDIIDDIDGNSVSGIVTGVDTFFLIFAVSLVIECVDQGTGRVCRAMRNLVMGGPQASLSTTAATLLDVGDHIQGHMLVGDCFAED